MRKIQLKNIQTAQGMVEFALVLPILLLLILGIFAFGHMFFVYSSVVSASREAARWGAAVGSSPSAKPRYQDCNSIRAAAVRVGAFAGVNPSNIDSGTDTGIHIGYDKGPGTTEIDTCPEGPSGSDVDIEMGDRIVVRVRVNYAPIVPVIQIPSFPLEAVTARTILINVPVGEAPIAEDPCATETKTEIIDNPMDVSVVGQPVTYAIRVSNVDTAITEIPTGTISLYDNYKGSTTTLCEELELVDGVALCTTTTYWEVADTDLTDHDLSAEYFSDNTCHINSATIDNHKVLPAETIIEPAVDISFVPSPVTAHQVLTINVTVRAVAPGAGYPRGKVQVEFPGLDLCEPELSDGRATCTFVPEFPGTWSVQVTYPDESNPNYLGYGPVTKNITVRPVATVTPTGWPTITITPTVTPGSQNTPTKTPLPPMCPRATGPIDFNTASALQFGIINSGTGAENVDVDSVEITWPRTPTTKLQEIRFGNDVSSCIDTGSGRNCLWEDNSGMNPPNRVISSGTDGWNSDNEIISLDSSTAKNMRLVFNASLSRGSYLIVVRFSNGCVLELDGSVY